MNNTSELPISRSAPLSCVHRLQAPLCSRSVHLHRNAISRVVECCIRKRPTTRQRGCERVTEDHNLKQQAGAIAATVLLSAGHACAPAEAYNVRLQDVENKAMQAGVQVTKPA